MNDDKRQFLSEDRFSYRSQIVQKLWSDIGLSKIGEQRVRVIQKYEKPYLTQTHNYTVKGVIPGDLPRSKKLYNLYLSSEYPLPVAVRALSLFVDHEQAHQQLSASRTDYSLQSIFRPEINFLRQNIRIIVPLIFAAIALGGIISVTKAIPPIQGNTWNTVNTTNVIKNFHSDDTGTAEKSFPPYNEH